MALSGDSPTLKRLEGIASISSVTALWDSGMTFIVNDESLESFSISFSRTIHTNQYTAMPNVCQPTSTHH